MNKKTVNQAYFSHSIKPAWGSGIAVKLSITIIIALIFASALISFLIYFNIKKSYVDLTQQRHFVVSSNIRKSAEYSLNLGLKLSEIKNIAELLEETAKKHPEIKELYVLDTRQKVIHKAKVSATITPNEEVLLIAEKTSDGEAHLELSGKTFLLVPIVNNFQVKVGTLVLSYSNEDVLVKLDDTIILLIKNAVISITIVALLVLLVVIYMTAGFKKRMLAMNSSLVSLMQDSSHDPEEIIEDGNFERSYLTFHEKAQELFYSFDATEKTLNKKFKDDTDAV